MVEEQAGVEVSSQVHPELQPLLGNREPFPRVAGRLILLSPPDLGAMLLRIEMAPIHLEDLADRFCHFVALLPRHAPRQGRRPRILDQMDPRRKAPDSWQAERARNCRLPSLVGGGGSPRSNPKSSSASGRPPLRRCRRKTSASPSTEESPFPRLWRPTSSPPSIPPPFSERPTMNPGHGNWRASLQICARWLSCSPRMVGEGLADLESTPPLRDRTESRPCWRRTRGRHGD